MKRLFPAKGTPARGKSVRRTETNEHFIPCVECGEPMAPRLADALEVCDDCFDSSVGGSSETEFNSWGGL